MSEIELHRKLLGDTRRNAAFHEALKAVIETGVTTVADVGAGTGFLSFVARRLGAKHCTLIEYTDALDLAEDLARRNRIDGLAFVKAHSSEVRRKLGVDVVVTETLGNFALEEGLLETAIDARRFLKPGGVILPSRLQQFVAPVFSDRVQAEIDIWNGIGYDLDLAPARVVCLNNMYVKSVTPADLGGDTRFARCWDDLDLRPDRPAPPSRRQRAVSWTGTDMSARQVHGFALWWDAGLVPGVTLSTSPSGPSTHWEQIYLPLLHAVDVDADDALELSLTCDTRPDVGVRLSWKTRHLRGSKVLSEQAQDSWKGRL